MKTGQVPRQTILDTGLNVFALDLLVESYHGLEPGVRAMLEEDGPLSFVHRSNRSECSPFRITIESVPETPKHVANRNLNEVFRGDPGSDVTRRRV